jgi:hypothetical protein
MSPLYLRRIFPSSGISANAGTDVFADSVVIPGLSDPYGIAFHFIDQKKEKKKKRVSPLNSEKKGQSA